MYAATKNDASARQVAIKQIEIGDLKNKGIIDTLMMMREVKLMCHFGRADPQHFVEVYDYYYSTLNRTPQYLYIVMEKLDGVPLNGEMNLGRRTTAIISRELLTAVSLMHSEKWRHRDIKLDNVFVTRDGKVKLLDFGIAGPVGETSQCGTNGYKAPEMMRGTTYVHTYVPAKTVTINNNSVDVQEPLSKEDKIQILKRCRQYEPMDIFSLGTTLLKLNLYDQDPDFREMIELMRRNESWRRPTAASLLNHPFITVNAPPQEHIDFTVFGV